MNPVVSTHPWIYPSRRACQDLLRHWPRLPLVCQKPVAGLDPALLFERLFRDDPSAFLLESGSPGPPNGRFSFMGAGTRRFLTADATGAHLFQGEKRLASGPVLEFLDRLDFDPHRPRLDYIGHFWGGWVGIIGYETARWLEPVSMRKTDDLNWPDLFLMETGPLIVYDHARGLLKCIVEIQSGCSLTAAYPPALKTLENFWERIESALLEITDVQAPAVRTHPVGARRISGMDSRSYEAMVRKAQAYIAEGDIYQANLAQRMEVPFTGDPLALYRRLRSINPSPFGGIIRTPHGTLVSSSPERLVEVKGSTIQTRPIAGTRPRGTTREEDQELSSELLLNEKERAEHLMLVDLERNDLGRLCQYGSVRVTDLMLVERYSHVQHIVSNIRGDLKPGVSLSGILKAVFPGGTITGCPKIRCMEIIEELEPHRRGPYCGSFGYIGRGPYLDLNIIIRTLLLKNQKAYFHVGAGIVADSDPPSEYRETLNKAAALQAALALDDS